MRYFLLFLIVLTCCKKSHDVKLDRKKPYPKIDYQVAILFINDYNKEFFNPQSETLEWLSKNKKITPSFIKEYKRILDVAKMEDPELGLDFDPIINAQDSDEKGFKIKKIDSIQGYLTIQGKSLPNFEIVVKVVLKNGVTLVDGCGVINIPKSKQPKQ